METGKDFKKEQSQMLLLVTIFACLIIYEGYYFVTNRSAFEREQAHLKAEQARIEGERVERAKNELRLAEIRKRDAEALAERQKRDAEALAERQKRDAEALAERRLSVGNDIAANIEILYSTKKRLDETEREKYDGEKLLRIAKYMFKNKLIENENYLQALQFTEGVNIFNASDGIKITLDIKRDEYGRIRVNFIP